MVTSNPGKIKFSSLVLHCKNLSCCWTLAVPEEELFWTRLAPYSLLSVRSLNVLVNFCSIQAR